MYQASEVFVAALAFPCLGTAYPAIQVVWLVARDLPTRVLVEHSAKAQLVGWVRAGVVGSPVSFSAW
jgi:hypothetical protein